MLHLINTRTSETIADNVAVADTIVTRFRGLMFARPLPNGHALVIRPCRQVHMFFMSFPLDLIFCSAEHSVLALQQDLKPWRVSRLVVGCKSVIELPAGTLARMDVRVRDSLQLLNR